MAELTRRRFLEAAAVWAGGRLLSEALPSTAAIGPSPVPVPSTLDGAPAILRQMIDRYAPVEDDAWSLMHGLRAIGRDFTVKGQKAVDFLCSRFLKQKSVNGRTYLYMPVEQEGHANAFLKTILEAGTPVSHSFRLNGKRSTVAGLVKDAKALFTFDPKTTNPDDIAWSLIAFSLQIPPSSDAWTDAGGHRMAFSILIRFGFDTLDDATARLRGARDRGTMPEIRDKIQGFTCGGTHLIYGLASCVGNGHRAQDFPTRLKTHLDLLVWRLEVEGRLIDQFYQQAPAPPDNRVGWENVAALYHNNAKIKFYGHSFEILSYVRHRRLFTPTAAQVRTIEKAGAILADAIAGIKGVDLFGVRKANQRLFRLLIGDCCHAYHGIHMVPGVNQV